MAKFFVNQRVLCEVSVTYHIEADSHEKALLKISDIKSPTSIGIMDGMDYEIIDDVEILKTTVIKD